LECAASTGTSRRHVRSLRNSAAPVRWFLLERRRPVLYHRGVSTRRVVRALLLLVLAACSSGPAPDRSRNQPAPASAPRTILVAGATGRQGGATVRALLERGYSVRALTRHPESERARKLAAAGVEVVKGDLGDPASLRAAVEGVDGVFSVTDYWEHGHDKEIAHGKNLADAAQAAGVKHFVFSSVGGANRALTVPHFESKWQVEQHLKTLSMPWTVLRPVSFMENWDPAELAGGKLQSPLAPTTHLQQISVDDIGRFAAEAFDHPDEWVGKTVEIAGDDRTMSEIALAMGNALGRPIDYVQVPWADFEKDAGPEITAMFKWFEADGYHADVANLRARHRFLTSFDAYLQRTWRKQ
jgi:uncharacterized protein YbjT (DUF2867 family)